MGNSRLITLFFALLFWQCSPVFAQTPGVVVRVDSNTKALVFPSESDLKTANHLSATPGTGNPRLGFVATGCRISSVSYTGGGQIMSRTYHVATDDISSVMLVYANWVNGGTGEAAPGGTITITASVEYPSGTYTQIKFSGSASGTATTGNNLFSDFATLPTTIPRGSAFWIRTYCTSPGTFPFGQGSSTLDGNNNGTSGIADLTMTSGSIAANKFSVRPVAIIGYTGRPSILLIGDSRVFGTGETPSRDEPDLTGMQGYERFVSRYGGYANFGNPGEAGSDFISSHTARMQLAQYATHVVCNYGINDITRLSVNLSTLQTTASTITGYFPGKPVYWSTLEPYTTSSDSWATLANQTVNANESVRVAWNDCLRALGSGSGFFGLSGYIEVADAVESSRDSGKWMPSYTADGAHSVASVAPFYQAVNIPILGSNVGSVQQNNARFGSLTASGLFGLTPQGAPGSPIAGQMYFDSSTSHFFGWNGSAWKQLDN